MSSGTGGIKESGGPRGTKASKSSVRLSKEVGKLRKRIRAAEGRMDALEQVFNQNFTALMHKMNDLASNDQVLKGAHDGLADRFFALLTVLRREHAELLTDEELVAELKKLVQQRLEKEAAAAKEEEMTTTEEDLPEDPDQVEVDKLGELLQDGAAAPETDEFDAQGVPTVASVFGG